MLLLHDWQNFYMLTGTAAATLTGLLFIAVSLGTNFSANQAKAYTRTFINPILLSYSQVLLLSCLAIMPLPGLSIYGILFIAMGCLNSYLALKICWRILVIHRDDNIDLSHWIWHVILPLLTGLTLGITAVGFLMATSWATLGLSITTLLFLTIGLRNTWVLTIWLLVRRIQETASNEASQPEDTDTMSYLG